jgi:phenylalanyl-tRNA synthetase beta chain
MLDHVKNMGHALVEQIEIFDIYRGAPIAHGCKSVGLTVQYRSPERTLDDVTVDKVHQNIIESLLTRFKGRLREGNE